MAAERADIMQTTIHNNCQRDGQPFAANIAPQSANGSAKMECSHLIISSVWRRLAVRLTIAILNGLGKDFEGCPSVFDCILCNTMSSSILTLRIEAELREQLDKL